MFKLAYKPMGRKNHQYMQCTPSWPSKDDAIIAAKGLVERKFKEGNPIDCIVSKKLANGSGEIVWDSEKMKTTIYFIDHPAPETLSEDATLEFRESLSLDAINTNNPEALQDAINCAEYYLSEGVHGNKGRAWIAQDGKTIWKSWESTTQGDARC